VRFLLELIGCFPDGNPNVELNENLVDPLIHAIAGIRCNMGPHAKQPEIPSNRVLITSLQDA